MVEPSMHKDEIKLSTSLDLEHAQVMRVILTCFLSSGHICTNCSCNSKNVIAVLNNRSDGGR